MQLYNTLSRRKEPFTRANQVITIYVCGITPYDTTHLGHLFNYAFFDVLIRYLETLGHKVRYTQNVTDIDDDILRKASEEGSDWRTLGSRWTNHFIQDNRDLNIRPPDHFPRATDVIEDILANVERLVSSGAAYVSGGNVYFDVINSADYGLLSRLTYDEMLPIANERGNRPDDPHKKDPLDFVLWQAQEPGEPAWVSPWGLGRPGWHIECSTMAAKYLGQPVDIHGGGADLLFPHHESEIVQAEGAGGKKPFTRFWLHVAMVRYENEKMSKSLGNLVMVRDLLNQGYKPDAIRSLMAGFHYREPWAFEESILEESARTTTHLIRALKSRSGVKNSLEAGEYQESFVNAMEDDLNTPFALNSLIGLANEIIAASSRGQDVVEAQKLLRKLAGILGLGLDRNGPEQSVIEGWNRHQQHFEN